MTLYKRRIRLENAKLRVIYYLKIVVDYLLIRHLRITNAFGRKENN